MSTKGFTKVENSIIFDMDLSLEAIGLYIKLKHLSTMKNFKINRSYVKTLSGYGETAFRRVWKELKDKKILLEVKTRKAGKFVYTFILEGMKKPDKVQDQNVEEKLPLDSEGNKPMNGQIYIDEVLEEKEDNEQNIEQCQKSMRSHVIKETNFNSKQVNELLKVAKNDGKRLLECYKYVLSQNNVKNIFNYTKWIIKNNKKISNDAAAEIKQDKFNSYPQRNYNFNALEAALLGEKVESLYS